MLRMGNPKMDTTKVRNNFLGMQPLTVNHIETRAPEHSSREVMGSRVKHCQNVRMVYGRKF